MRLILLASLLLLGGCAYKTKDACNARCYLCAYFDIQCAGEVEANVEETQ